jgi:phosphatidylserine decarboxylase
MKFGSRMDLILPENVDIMVGKGEKTVAGESIIGKIR